MTRTEFESRFGTEEQCQQYLFNKKWADGFICPKCKHTEYFNISTRQLYQCKKCNHQTSLTAGTIMDKSRVPLVNWFLAIFLMIHEKRKLTILRLQGIFRQCEMYTGTYNTMWTMHKRLRLVAEENSGFDTFDSFFESESFYAWRSRQKQQQDD